MVFRTFVRIDILLLVILATQLGNGQGHFCQAQSPGLIEFSVGGERLRGMTLVALAHEMIVIGRDGWLHSIDPRSDQTQVRSIPEAYSPVSVPELRNQLRAEFGSQFEVLTTSNFLVVQPKGRGDRWPNLFEKSHRGFVSFMARRGVHIRQGRFPMVAIVFPDEVSMYEAFKKEKIDMTRVAGVYSILSNRVMTHDGRTSSVIEATVRHEAAHQSAFNSGVHSRVNDTPRWVTEGIGQMFEPEAMTTAQSPSQRRERVNADSMMVIKKMASEKDSESLVQQMRSLIGSDAKFNDDKQVDAAYAISWAMMFYLSERQPKQFAAILNHTASRAPLKKYARDARLADFENIVGMSLNDFSSRVSMFLRTL
ncbi:hypothetical protein CA13_69210 [Planctomycetes bacterium CA13]|uniref:DUF1570 domain-containing protein n=1 Tax=Novipirellula herctigrandis TaxID=2527986 RepID=A0A5C5YNL9_9BACT|nr:hypothetical protein CA13_69210 [Planctomycetes bacterium CA13]